MRGYGDRTIVFYSQGSGLHGDATHFPLNARVECRSVISERLLVGLRWHAEEAVVFLGFTDEPGGKEHIDVHGEGAQR